MFQITEENLRISRHARERMTASEVSVREVYDIAVRPFLTEAQPDGRERRRRDGVVLVIAEGWDRKTYVVITVLDPRQERWSDEDMRRRR